MSKHFQAFTLLALCCFTIVGCQHQSTVNTNTAVPNSNQITESPIKSPLPTPTPAAVVRPILKITSDGVPILPDNLDSPIRKIDFENFTYPWLKGYRGANSAYPGKYFKLKNGKLPHRIFSKHGIPHDVSISGTEIGYCDLTNDKKEEAIVMLFPSHSGTGITSFFYIYTLQSNKPKLLWSFETGDRADGGFKEIYVEDSILVIELDGKNKYIGGNLYAEDETSKGACCPTMYTRTRYKWNGKRFVMQGKPESYPLN